jgi:hypothetical protein
VSSPSELGLSARDWLLAQAEVEEAAPGAGSLLTDVFVEEPVPLDVFIQDKKFIGMSPLSGPQYSALRATERIYYSSIYSSMAAEFDPYWTPIPMVNFLTLLVGKGGGKDLLARLASLRIAYLLLCLKDPKSYFGFPSDESIHMLNVASTKDQARLAFFEPMTRIVARGWFKHKCNPLRAVIEWEKGITSISGSSDAETQEGLNLLLGVADEVDAFRTAEEVLRHSGPSQRAPMRSAEGIIKMMRTSSLTRFPQTFKNLRISYPRYYGSPILTLHAAAMDNIAKKGEESRHFVVGPMPSWEFNPLLARSEFKTIPQSPIPVPIELVEDFENDPDWSRAAYLCRPARTRLPPYFRNETVIDAALIEMPEILVNWELMRGAWHATFSIPRELQPAEGAVYACHADLALTGDRCGFAMAHVVSWDHYEQRDPETGDKVRYEDLPIVRVDVALTLEADLRADPPREIQLRAVRQLIFELRNRGFGMAWASLDGWQSQDTKQALIVAGIESSIVSMDKTEEPYRLLRSMVEEARVTMPSSLLLRAEIRGLQQDPRTRKVDHQPGDGSKDLSDAVCGSVWGAVACGGAESTQDEYTGDEFWTDSPLAAPLGAEAVWSSIFPH